jgi:hypothetical protein
MTVLLLCLCKFHPEMLLSCKFLQKNNNLYQKSIISSIQSEHKLDRMN